MARSAEKAMAILSRWTTMMANEGKEEKATKRPYLATECDNLPEAEKWRRQVIRDISKRVAQVQNAGLGEFRIRDLNDEINKLIREKRHWEDRVLELGGPDYAKVGPKMLDNEGKELPGNRGYKYFGAAKELPGVRELFEQEPPKPVRKTRAELYKAIDADYYGYRDEDDGVLLTLEAEIEKRAIAEAVAEWQQKKDLGEVESSETDETDIYAVQETEESDDVTMENVGEAPESFVAHVPVPSQQDVEDMLVRRKKRELLERYASNILMSQSEEAKTLMGL
ncbi:pre-mRNA-splicing factor ISY1 homolog [Rhopilema esculentum]|uniref:pre-mRNA-splicing factor ISY1 homolog n=1 Tax=Rhopilema esculentum TaxID=499914 RepID=UPI0031DB1277|eukprot:gene3015-1278_t